jgi:hypothetical protein
MLRFFARFCLALHPLIEILNRLLVTDMVMTFILPATFYPRIFGFTG